MDEATSPADSRIEQDSSLRPRLSRAAGILLAKMTLEKAGLPLTDLIQQFAAVDSEMIDRISNNFGSRHPGRNAFYLARPNDLILLGMHDQCGTLDRCGLGPRPER